MRLIQSACMILALACMTMPAAAQEQVQDEAGYERRLELSKKMHEIRPAREQVNSAIERAAQAQPPAEREAFKTAMRSILNFRAIEKISTDAMAEVYTEDELKAMIEYYSKPEAQSAREKQEQYGELVYPEIIRMLDEAMIRVKTGGAGR